jgi:hypothetical protein
LFVAGLGPGRDRAGRAVAARIKVVGAVALQPLAAGAA